MPSRKLYRSTVVAALWLAVWAFASARIGRTLLLPSPLDTARALLHLIRTGALLGAVASSFWRIMLGFAGGVLLGAFLSITMHLSRWANDLFRPLLSTVNATPVVSFILLALVFLRVNGVPTFATVLVVLPLAASNLSAGLRSADGELLEMARAFSMPWRARIFRLYWPTVRPYLRAAFASGMGMAWKAGVAAEVICTPKSALGSLLYRSKVYLNTPELFATTAVIILLSVLLEKCVRAIITPKKGGPAA